MAGRRASTGARLVGRELRHVVPAQDVVDELAVSIGDERRDVAQRVATVLISRVLGGHDEVDTVGTVSDLGFDPSQVDLELLG